MAAAINLELQCEKFCDGPQIGRPWMELLRFFAQRWPISSQIIRRLHFEYTNHGTSKPLCSMLSLMPVNRCGFGHTRNGQTDGLEYKKKKEWKYTVMWFRSHFWQICRYVNTLRSGLAESHELQMSERRASAFFNKWRLVWYSHRSEKKEKKSPIQYREGLFE